MIDLGPDSFESSPAPAPAAQPRERAWAQVDLEAIRANIARLQEAAPRSELMAVVKADAYGHGLLPVAKAAREAGATWLGTALLQEALALREAGDQGRILTWLPTPGDRFDLCIRNDIDLSASSTWMISEIAAAAAAVGKRARVHLKIDTGLGRSGAAADDIGEVIREALAATRRGEIEVVGAWSHLAYADSPDHPTIAMQLEVFDKALRLIENQGISLEVRHIANSAATLRSPETHFDLVRPGIAVYGISPGEEVGTDRSLGLRPAMTLGARLVMVKRLPGGHGISYAHQYLTKEEATVGLVPLGYADGIQRCATNVGPVLAGGRIRHIAGRVCMDQFVLDFGDDPARAGDEVILFGPGDRGEPSAHDWAEACGTIAYEIVTCVGPRVPRIYVGAR